MIRSSRLAPLLSIGVGTVGFAALAFGLSGCDGNPTCVFTGTCGSTPGGLAGNPAVLPEPGQVIIDGRPTIVDTFPSGADIASSSPIVIVFSESMNEGTLTNVIQVVPINGGLSGPPVTGIPQVLVAEGRVLVLLPPTLPAADEYWVQLAGDSLVTDITGVELDENGGAVLGRFSVNSSNPLEPSLVTVFPRDASAGQSELGEVVAIFDRAMKASTIDGDSFVVLVDGEEPAEDPDPIPLVVTVGGFPITDNRVFRWRSAQDDGTVAALGAGVEVSVSLSPVGNEITDDNDEVLPPFEGSYHTSFLATPIDAALLSQPSDAIGIANLTAGHPEELLIQVELADGEPEDKLDLFLFGTTLAEEPILAAVLRTVVLEGTAPILVVDYTLADVDLLLDTSPITPRFAQGDLAFAFRARRGTEVTPLMVLDADPDSNGIQDVTLDTMGPTIQELLRSDGVTDLFRSDQRDLVIAGHADEEITSVEVSTSLGDNGVLPPVVGSSADGLFIAAPVLLDDPLTTTLDYSIIAYDSANNASDPFTGTFTQIGGVGPGAFVPGDPIVVEVFDAVTLAPLLGARVIVHGDDGLGGYPYLENALTDALGAATVASAASGETIVSVDLATYDLFTFHGVTSNRISIPLRPTTASSPASVEGVAGSSDLTAMQILPILDTKVADSRRDAGEASFYDGSSCFVNPFGSGELECPYGPEPIRPERLGGQSWLAGAFGLTYATFSPAGVIQAFDLVIPTSPTLSGELDETSAWIPYVFSDPVAPAEEVPVELPEVQVIASAVTGLDLENLEGDPLTTGDPWVSVETIAPGIPDPIPVGIGLAFDQGSEVWSVRSAYPGVVGDLGYFGLNGIVDTDFFIRFELRDVDGNVAGQASRVSALPGLALPDTLIPTGVPQISAPIAGGNTGGSSFEVVFGDTLFDAYAQTGIYRVELVDSAGRGWTLWRPDSVDADGPDVSVQVPDLTEGGGTPLTDGQIAAQVFLQAAPDLDLSRFLWVDLAREPGLFAEAASISFVQP